jgi:hypothetical protein
MGDEPMKTRLKIAVTLALAGTALASAAAGAANLITNPPATGGSDLILFVSDLTSSKFFIQDLANPLDTIYSKAQLTADGVLATQGHFNSPAGIAGPDAALATFLSGLTAGDNVQYSFIAGDHSTHNENSGSQRFLFTSTLDLSGGTPYGTSTAFSNSNINQSATNLSSFVTWINSNCLSGNTCASGWGDSSPLGTTSGGKGAPNSWISANFANGAALGTASTMYMAGTNGAGLASLGNTYIGGMLDVSSTGVISVTNSAVPVPAAVWLFGSGLLGLLGIGRRRVAAA